jgi:PAS domain S-box-containing protein
VVEIGALSRFAKRIRGFPRLPRSPRLIAVSREVGAVSLLAATYYVTARLGLHAAAAHKVVSSLWPPAGIALFALLRFGLHLWPGVTLGAFLLNALSGVPMAGAAAIAAGNTLAAVAGTFLLSRVAGFHRGMDRLRDVLALAGMAGVASTLISASIGVAALSLSGAASAPLLPLWEAWWSGDAVGILVLTPLLLVWTEPAEPEPASVWRHLESVLMFAALVLVTDLVFRSEDSYAYTVFPLVTWIAFRRGRRGATAGIAVVALIASHHTMAGMGRFAVSTPLHNLFLLQAFLGVLAVPCLLFAAALAERLAAQAHLAQHARQLSAAQRLAVLGTWHWDVRRDVVRWSPELREICGLGVEAFDGTLEDFLGRVHPDDHSLVQNAVQQALVDGRGFRMIKRIVRPDGEIRFLATTGETMTDSSGSVVAMTGVCQDVTDQRRAAESLRDSERRFRVFVEAVRDYAIFTLAPDGCLSSWNAGAELIYGYRAEEVMGRSYALFFPTGDIQAGKPSALLQKAAATGQVTEEGWRVRKNGSWYWADSLIVAVLNENREVTGFTKVSRDISEQRKYMELQQRLVAMLIGAQEDERRRIARELHDEVGQSLTALQVALGTIRKKASLSAVRRHAGRMHAIIDGTLAEVGRLALGLHPKVLDDLGLEAAVTRYARDYATLHGIAMDVRTSGLRKHRLPAHVELAVYRIVVEALTNIARHSHASSARIFLRRNGTSVEAILDDDGRGFDVADALHDRNHSPALGLHSMRERAAMVGGSLTIDSRPAGGSTVTLRVPLNGPPHD